MLRHQATQRGSLTSRVLLTNWPQPWNLGIGGSVQIIHVRSFLKSYTHGCRMLLVNYSILFSDVHFSHWVDPGPGMITGFWFKSFSHRSILGMVIWHVKLWYFSASVPISLLTISVLGICKLPLVSSQSCTVACAGFDESHSTFPSLGYRTTCRRGCDPKVRSGVYLLQRC